MIRVLVSACLLGERVRYDGADALRRSSVLDRWVAEGRVVPFCPEVAGGLSVPRPPAEIRGGGGGAVLDGTARVVTVGDADVTDAFRLGAQRALNLAQLRGIRVAVLKEGSPSCGRHVVYDGSFQGRKVAGQGVTAALLERNGIRVFSDVELEQAAGEVARLEGGA